MKLLVEHTKGVIQVSGLTQMEIWSFQQDADTADEIDFLELNDLSTGINTRIQKCHIVLIQTQKEPGDPK